MYSPNHHPPKSSYEFVVAVLSNGLLEGSGVLISPQHILTAAHLETPNEIFIGSDISEGGTKIEIVNQNVFNEYDAENRYGDLAILKLAQPLELKPIPLYGQAVEMNQKVCLVGFGATDAFGREGHGTRRQTSPEGELSVISVNCDEQNIKDNFRCVEGNFVACNPEEWDSCKGDSGGAALIFLDGNGYLAGIISSGPDAGCGQGSVLVRLDLPERKEWIQKTISAES
jgi:secreted trypsin-like serine protease